MNKPTLISTLAVALVLSACSSQQTQTSSPTPTTESEVMSYSTSAPTVTDTPQNTPIAVSEKSTNNPSQKAALMKKATIETNLGNITIEFYPEDAPQTVTNFQKLASSGFYNNVTFHRVISGFMIQGGDPAGTGTGGPGYKFNDEINKDSQLYKTGYKKGIVAMANAGPNTNGSQFFIMHADYPLPPSYTIFGKVVEGLDVVDKIAASETDANDKPTTAVVMKSVKLSN
jgi:cyclophilin family peptidyl-prolyl cis-trans isomerase